MALTNLPFSGGCSHPRELNGLENKVTHDSKLKFQELLNGKVQIFKISTRILIKLTFWFNYSPKCRFSKENIRVRFSGEITVSQ
jgi:hypothetical protein